MEWSTEDLEKIANLRSHKVSAAQICIIMGCEESDLDKVVSAKEFEKYEAEKRPLR